MLQRRTTSGIFVGKCSSTGPDAPDRLSCSISRCGAERTNANEMQGAGPVTTYCPSLTTTPGPAVSADAEHTLSLSNVNIISVECEHRFAKSNVSLSMRALQRALNARSQI